MGALPDASRAAQGVYTRNRDVHPIPPLPAAREIWLGNGGLADLPDLRDRGGFFRFISTGQSISGILRVSGEGMQTIRVIFGGLIFLFLFGLYLLGL